MTENTNPSSEVEESLADYIENDDVQTEDVAPQEPHKFVKKLKVNGEEKDYEFTDEELTEKLQKGLHYETLRSERDAIKNTLSELAKDEGLKLDEYLNKLKESKFNAKIESKKKELEEQGIPSELAQKYAELEIKQAPKDNPLEKSFLELYEEFPETKDLKELTDYPQEVIEAIQNGKNPVVAYSKWKVSQATKVVETTKVNETNKVKDTGSLGTKDSGGKVDDILQGFRGL